MDKEKNLESKLKIAWNIAEVVAGAIILEKFNVDYNVGEAKEISNQLYYNLSIGFEGFIGIPLIAHGLYQIHSKFQHLKDHYLNNTN